MYDAVKYQSHRLKMKIAEKHTGHEFIFVFLYFLYNILELWGHKQLESLTNLTLKLLFSIVSFSHFFLNIRPPSYQQDGPS